MSELTSYTAEYTSIMRW